MTEPEEGMAVHLNRGIRYLLTASKAGSNPAPVLILSWCCHMASQPVAVVPIRTANKNMMEGVNPCLLMKSCDGKRSGSRVCGGGIGIRIYIHGSVTALQGANPLPTASLNQAVRKYHI